MSLKVLYEHTCEAPSDIQAHLPKFVELVEELDATKVIELGVRWGTSTIAWLYALEQRGHLWSVDIDPPPPFPDYEHWTFLLGDDCSPEVLDALPTTVDIVFIDSSHNYEHTLRELALYRPRVRPGGRIVLHDTELDQPAVAFGQGEPFPVKRAVTEFCAEHNLEWTNYPYCYGLGVVEV